MELTEKALLLIFPSARQQAGVFVPACESAAWFWHSRGLNQLADRGEFNRITRHINGGLNGLEDRLQLWVRAREVLG